MRQIVFEESQVTNGSTRAYLKVVIVFLLLFGLVITLLVGGLVVLAVFDDDTSPRIYQVYLADLNGDSQLDAFLVYLNELNRVLLNDGSGRFTTAEELMMHSYALALGDLNGDGQLDAIVNNFGGETTELQCVAAPSGFSLISAAAVESGQPFAVRDVDSNGVPESFLAGCCNGTTTVFNYDTFSENVPCLSQERTNAVALADLNGSGALDAFLAKGRLINPEGQAQRYSPNEVWFNDGQGNFTDSGQRLGQAESLAVVVGDVNGDGFPDAVVGNRGPDEVWLNDGQGIFNSSGQRLGSGLTRALFLVDLDGDGDPDLFAAGDTSGRVWLNDGAGKFQAGQRISYGRHKAIALGDVTGDGLVDLFEAGVESYRVWRGSGDGRFTAGEYDN
jgi:hypothetical protein